MYYLSLNTSKNILLVLAFIIKKKNQFINRVLMQCEYIGKFNECHNSFKKRRMIGPVKDKAIASIFGEGLSCEIHREREAERLIKEGTFISLFIKLGEV